MQDRQINKIYYAPKFERRFCRLTKNTQLKALEKENIFRKNCFDPRLKTHRLKGRYKNYWSFSINYSYRILFQFCNDQEALFMDVGTHNIYQ